MTAEHPIAGFVDNMVYEPGQVHEDGVDLTVAVIYEVTEPGSVDFGGDELADAELEPHPTVRRASDDDYEWWHLDGGQYVLQYNEFLTEPETPLFLQPRNEVLARGAFHPTVFVDGHLPLVPVSVADGGINLKENARVSILRSATAMGDRADETLDDVRDVQ